MNVLNEREKEILRIIRDMVGGEEMPIVVGGAVLAEEALAENVTLPFTDIDVIIRNPEMTTEAISIGLEALAVVKYIDIRVTKPSKDQDYGIPCILRRFNIKAEGCKDIDLLCIAKEPNNSLFLTWAKYADFLVEKSIYAKVTFNTYITSRKESKLSLRCMAHKDLGTLLNRYPSAREIKVQKKLRQIVAN